MVISRLHYHPLKKRYFLVLKSVKKSYTYFGVGLKPPKCCINQFRYMKLYCIVGVSGLYTPLSCIWNL